MRFTHLWRNLVLAFVLAATFPWGQALSQSQSPTQSSSAAATSKPKRNQSQVKCADNGSYVNSKGRIVKRPENCSGSPAGATARCRDGTYSFSQSRRGTCSHHGGVASWL